jgi:hypothetical protein
VPHWLSDDASGHRSRNEGCAIPLRLAIDLGMPQITRTWESPNPEANAQRMRRAEEAVRNADRVARSALGHVAMATAAGKTSSLLVEAAGHAVAADAAAAEAIAALREARDLATRDQRHFDSVITLASEKAIDAYQQADLSIEKCPTP